MPASYPSQPSTSLTPSGGGNYNVGMKANLVAIGNSRGVRIPKAVLDLTGLSAEVEMEVRGAELVLRSASHPRAMWDQSFAAVSNRPNKADKLKENLLDPPVATHWDETEWEWQ